VKNRPNNIIRHPELVSPMVTAFRDNALPSRVILKQVQEDEAF